MSSSRVFSGFLLLSISFILVSAFRPGGTVQDAQLAARDQHDTINITEYALTDTMKGTLQKLEDLETMPSCEKVASAELMYSCAAIDGTVIAEEDGIPRGADHLLDVQKTLYAARLAVCELNVGKDSVPAACQAFVTTPKSTRKTFWRSSSVSRGWKGFWQTYPVYEEATEATLEQCLVALQRCGPCWNSYSNSRQNAVHICHAMRAEREKDEQIHLFKVLANTAWDLTGTMGQSKEQWKETQTLMHDFTDYIRRFWQDLVKDNAEELQRTSRLWADVEIGVRGGLADILADVREAQSVLVDTRRSLTEHHQNINTTVQDTSAQLTDLVASQYDAMGVLSYSGDQLNDKLAYIHETLMQDLALRIYNATQDLDNTNVLMGVFNQQLNQSSVTLSRTMGQLDALRSEIDDLRQSLQRAHADNERMTLEMQAKANRTLEIADQANENMEKLGSGIASLSEFLSGGWAGAIGILEKTATFAMYALIYSLLNFGGWQCLTRYSTLGCAAASTATGLGLAIISVAYYSPVDCLRQLYQITTDNATATQHDPVYHAGVIYLAVLAAISLLWRSRLRRGLQSVLPSYGKHTSDSEIPSSNETNERTAMRLHGGLVEVMEKEEKDRAVGRKINSPKYWDDIREQNRKRWQV